MDESTWHLLESATSLTQDKIMNTLGHESIDLLPILVTTYFLNREKLEALDSQMSNKLHEIFS